MMLPTTMLRLSSCIVIIVATALVSALPHHSDSPSTTTADRTTIFDPAKHSTSAAPTATLIPSNSSDPASGSSMNSPLFPVSPQLAHWTTSTSLPGALPVSDDTFKPFKMISDLAHNYVKAPDGELSMQAHYPKGSYNFDHKPRGGFSFYAPGPASVDLTTAKEATFGYTTYFPTGYDFVKGGKLPGLYGGDSDDEAVSCSGGRRDDGCFSVRMMWRTNGAGELYTYLPPDFKENQNVCKVPPQSICNDVYGASVGRGAFTFKTGARTTVSQRVRLNDVGQANGELELFVSGKSVISVSGLTIRDKASGRLRGMQFQTFFGGSTPDFATTKDQDAYFSDFSVAITQML